ncbi:hypothetical protein [Aquimarina sp. AU119]|uniref:hypothetical protein n=1 Tax=Aquimarina sp. AU119 TaxID=2108528 RepID=UPI000D688AE6|nr:hypothetical protein [Aquimarina sp. AU119]
MKFIELTLKSHIIVHGFDARNQEIIEEVHVEKASRKLVAMDRILSVSDKYILIQYAYDRIIYWEYMESFEELQSLLE